MSTQAFMITCAHGHHRYTRLHEHVCTQAPQVHTHIPKQCTCHPYLQYPPFAWTVTLEPAFWNSILREDLRTTAILSIQGLLCCGMGLESETPHHGFRCDMARISYTSLYFWNDFEVCDRVASVRSGRVNFLPCIFCCFVY